MAASGGTGTVPPEGEGDFDDSQAFDALEKDFQRVSLPSSQFGAQSTMKPQSRATIASNPPLQRACVINGLECV